MAGSVQPRAEKTNHESATVLMLDDVLASGSGAVTRAEKTRIGGSIVMGILIGAVAAFLVGGLVGIHETSTGVVRVSSTSIVHPAAP
jgi:hypothetical protein